MQTRVENKIGSFKHLFNNSEYYCSFLIIFQLIYCQQCQINPMETNAKLFYESRVGQFNTLQDYSLVIYKLHKHARSLNSTLEELLLSQETAAVVVKKFKTILSKYKSDFEMSNHLYWPPFGNSLVQTFILSNLITLKPKGVSILFYRLQIEISHLQILVKNKSVIENMIFLSCGLDNSFSLIFRHRVKLIKKIKIINQHIGNTGIKNFYKISFPRLTQLRFVNCFLTNDALKIMSKPLNNHEGLGVLELAHMIQDNNEAVKRISHLFGPTASINDGNLILIARGTNLQKLNNFIYYGYLAKLEMSSKIEVNFIKSKISRLDCSYTWRIVKNNAQK